MTPPAEPPAAPADLAPRPRLTLGSHVHSGFDLRSGRMQNIARHRAALAFLYAGMPVSGPINPRTGSELRVFRDDRIVRLSRQPEREQQLRQQLRQFGFKPAMRRSDALEESAGEMFELPDDATWQQFMREGLPQLRERGWDVDVRPEFVFDLTPIENWYAEIEETDDRQWFDLELGIEVDGRRISLLPALIELIRRMPALLDPQALARHSDDEQLVLRLDAGRNPVHSWQTASERPLRVALPFGKLKPLLGTLSEFYLGDQAPVRRLRMGAPDAARLSELEELPLRWQGGDELREIALRLRDYRAQPAPLPEGLRAELRAYQHEGLSWMQTLRAVGASGILADDMGLGKTLQSLAHVLLEKQAGRLSAPALVVMPTSLIPNWLDEAERFTPSLRVLALHGAGRRRDFAKIEEHDLILTTYALLPRDAEKLGKHAYHLLILDEAQNIKNAGTKAAQAARQLNARHRLCLTGTPLENHLGELWSLFHFLLPGWLGDAKQFAQHYRTPIERHGDQARLAHLAARIRPFLLRRTKEQVASELPPKSEFIQHIELSEAQRDLYETVRLALDRKVRDEIARRGLARSRIIILEALLKLRQVCCDIRLVQKDAPPPSGRAKTVTSGKLEYLLDMLEELLAEGRRVLLFSQFTSMLALVGEALQQRGIDYALLTGDSRDRRQPVEDFQQGRVPLFLISLKAGGVGLNLTAADTVIHYDPWWNPAAENQASDRAYRIGQDKPVFVYKLIARGTVEEKIQLLQREKAALAAGILEGAGTDWQLDDADIDALFAPLPKAV
ncbi:Superfamily II DNA or RNA helicase, SNF2 family [Pseudomonas citronellolis]|uniref:Superfamily II DNA or RNA helicase, SNF2 family n=2 Tax=Pseudomonas citronellolis TaxID=53408 RepID=A0AAQ1KG86_9PSED|nr:superfamily II DNA or RNA helicase [Pseudomonas citronellolis]MCP1657346.1 superfamily II DNA or RNA helicase [Pseudomonas citronellolis]MCP1724161.1 superfamily II DNA or RNA helicase [Pseudomonas citronellolis]GBL55880.1 helicase [Pseudomonas citronellolis]SFD08901.1 Superfamily II DNA or RNA helicase, SNF2 family [Pseudomonas citronellolis]